MTSFDAKAKFHDACRRAGITPERASGPDRWREVSNLRTKVMVMMRAEGMSLEAIGETMNRHHATVKYHVDKAHGKPRERNGTHHSKKGPGSREYHAQKNREWRVRQRSKRPVDLFARNEKACGLEMGG